MCCEVSVPLTDPLGMGVVVRAPPSLGYCASPLVMGVAVSGREILQLSCHSCTRLRPASPLWVRGGLVVGDGDEICPLQGSGSTFSGYFSASACWHPA